MEDVVRFAMVNNARREAQPGLIGYCPGCSQPMIAKCGMQRVPHWAHRGNRNCDPWWEPETHWHRTWKNNFPLEWQEAIRRDERGEKHIADVLTEHGLVIEFQHSHLPAREKAARECFHRNMVWVVDGTRLKRDGYRFLKARSSFRPTLMKGVFVVPWPNEGFPSAWLDCAVPVFFDFVSFETASEALVPKQDVLWCLLPGRAEGRGVVAAVSRSMFLDTARKRAEIIPGRKIVEMIATDLRRERVAAELSARRWAYAHTPNSKWSRRRRRSRY
ncbi:MAG: competence protein [Mesorhizobium sp.]|nr:MAG: competence protein [Mesorhizobium sp.]